MLVIATKMRPPMMATPAMAPMMMPAMAPPDSPESPPGGDGAGTMTVVACLVTAGVDSTVTPRREVAALALDMAVLTAEATAVAAEASSTLMVACTRTDPGEIASVIAEVSMGAAVREAVARPVLMDVCSVAP